MLDNKKTLEPEQLGKISGGSKTDTAWAKKIMVAQIKAERAKKNAASSDASPVTQMECPCGYSAKWAGDYVGVVVTCTNCGEETLKGVSRIR